MLGIYSILCFNMEIKILGSNCDNCLNLEANTRTALAELGLDAQVFKEADFMKIASYGVMRTPALVINEKVIFQGRVASIPELKDIILKIK